MTFAPSSTGPPGTVAGEVDLGADEPAGPEDVPELDVLGGVRARSRVVELEVDQLDVQLQRLAGGGRPAACSPGAEGRHAVVALGAVDREQPVLDVEGRGEVVDRIGELGAVPDPLAEPGRTS